MPKSKTAREIIDGIKKDITENVEKYSTISRSTCSAAPANGWSLNEYIHMPTVAQELSNEGIIGCRPDYRHGVYDWHFYKIG